MSSRTLSYRTIHTRVGTLVVGLVPEPVKFVRSSEEIRGRFSHVGVSQGEIRRLGPCKKHPTPHCKEPGPLRDDYDIESTGRFYRTGSWVDRVLFFGTVRPPTSLHDTYYGPGVPNCPRQGRSGRVGPGPLGFKNHPPPSPSHE